MAALQIEGGLKQPRKKGSVGKENLEIPFQGASQQREGYPRIPFITDARPSSYVNSSSTSGYSEEEVNATGKGGWGTMLTSLSPGNEKIRCENLYLGFGIERILSVEPGKKAESTFGKERG